MKLVNESRWDTDDLRALFFAMAKHEGLSLRGVLVRVKTLRARTRFVKGNGHMFPAFKRIVVETRTRTEAVYSGAIDLSIAIPDRFVSNPVDAIAVVEHGPAMSIPPSRLAEIGAKVRILIRAAVLGASVRIWSPTPDAMITAGLVMRPKSIEKHPRVVGAELQTAKLTTAREKLAVWKTRLKRAQGKVKKYEREIRRRERLLSEDAS